MVSALAVGIALLPPASPPVQAAAGRTPLPSDRLHFGLGNDPGQQTWFTASGVPWRYRYAYLAGGVNNAGGTTDPCGANAGWQTWNSPAGQYATYYVQNSAAAHAIPVFTYYEINQSNPYANDESAELAKVSNVCLMQAYWADFTVLMEKVGAFGGQVVVHVEPDFWGFMEHRSADPTTLPAAVAGSGNPDLAGLPDTVAGMGLAFLKLRDKYAPNALLAIHASSWASGVDIASDTRTTVDPNAEADKVAAFLDKAGIAGNPSGITPWDAVFNDVADHDAGYSGIWWDKTNAVFPNFARWLAFMSRLHADTGLPLVEWQVPVGNQYFDTMNDTPGHYQDNRAAYFLAHPGQLTAAGIVAVLFGKANANQTDYTDDTADGVTNPAPISSWQCNLCNSHVSAVSDDDGGYLRMAVGAYYRESPGTIGCATPAPSASPPSPAVSGTSVALTASTATCPNPRYEFWMLAAGTATWRIVQPYSNTATFTWNSTGALTGTEQFGVWVRDAASTAPYDAYTGLGYSVTAPACAGVTASASPPSPIAHGTGAYVTITATPAGCTNPSPLYEFWMLPAGSSAWVVVRGYSTSASFVWSTAGAPAGTERFGVWIRDAASTRAYDAFVLLPYTLT